MARVLVHVKSKPFVSCVTNVTYLGRRRGQDPINPDETVIVIRSLVPGGVAAIDGRLVPGDRLVFVNDVNLDNAKLDDVRTRVT